MVILEPWLKMDGWIISLYGSILKYAEGHDIDIIATPWRPSANVSSALRHMEDAINFKDTTGIPYVSAMGSEAYKGMCDVPGGHVLVDISFREVKPRMV